MSRDINSKYLVHFIKKYFIDSYPVVAGSDIEDRQKCEPDDAGGVHGEPNELGLVEVFRALSRLESVDSAEDDEDAVVGE